MNNEGVKISYGDIAVGAKENFAPQVNLADIETFVDLTQLNKYNLSFPNYGNPCEYGMVLLNSSTIPFPSNPQDENMGIWFSYKENLSSENPIILTLTADGQYSSQGLTFTFDTNNNVYCNNLDISWYREDTLLETKNFTPNSAFYFCHNKVENFNKLIIKFNSINLAGSRIRLRSIDFGYGTFFYGDVLRDVNVIQELDPISSEMPSNTVDFTLDSNTDIEYSFQSKQPLSVYFNGELRAVCFVTSSTRESKSVWKVETEDYIGQLSKLTFTGDIYVGKNAKELLENIFSQANIPLEVDTALNNAIISGHIPICDCREAVRQICFAIGAVCTTANRDNVYIYKLSNNITQTIPLSRIQQGQSFNTEDRVTEVRVTSHSFWISIETTNLYEANESGTGDEIFVQFSAPMANLIINNGEILKNEDNTLKCSANYAIIKAEEGCVLKGNEYKDATTVYTKRNNIISVNDLENIIEVTDATLVTKNNVDEVITSVFNNAIKTNGTSLKIYEGKSRKPDTGAIYGYGIYGGAKYGVVEKGGFEYDSIVNLGDIITAETEYLGNVTGRIKSQRYSLNGGIIVKECEMA